MEIHLSPPPEFYFHHSIKMILYTHIFYPTFPWLMATITLFSVGIILLNFAVSFFILSMWVRTLNNCLSHPYFTWHRLLKFNSYHKWSNFLSFFKLLNIFLIQLSKDSYIDFMFEFLWLELLWMWGGDFLWNWSFYNFRKYLSIALLNYRYFLPPPPSWNLQALFTDVASIYSYTKCSVSFSPDPLQYLCFSIIFI